MARLADPDESIFFALIGVIVQLRINAGETPGEAYGKAWMLFNEIRRQHALAEIEAAVADAAPGDAGAD